jgi:hypothetical protein
MREHAGLTINEAAALHGTDRTTVSNTESARSGVSSDRVRVWAANYACGDAEYVDTLAAMARERGTHWWDEYRDVVDAASLDLAELEHHAVALKHMQLIYMPGLLQNEDYARAVFDQALAPLAPEDLDRRLSFRVRRGEVLDRPDAPTCTFLIHEAALRMRFGSAETNRGQLHSLLKNSERENVVVRVVPFSAGAFPNVGSSSVYAYGPVRQLDTIQIDVAGGMAFLHAETHQANYRSGLDRLEALALTQAQSRDFIRAVTREL